jgi:hypothetical protein
VVAILFKAIITKLIGIIMMVKDVNKNSQPIFSAVASEKTNYIFNVILSVKGIMYFLVDDAICISKGRPTTLSFIKMMLLLSSLFTFLVVVC